MKKWLLILSMLCVAPSLAWAKEIWPKEIPAQDLRMYPVYDAVAVGKRIIAVGEWGLILTSADGGQKWALQQAPTEETLTEVRFIDESSGWAVGHHGTILKTTDGGATWTARTPDMQASDPLLGVYFADKEHGFTVGSFGFLLETKDGGKTWQKRDIGQGDMHLKAINGSPDGNIYIAGEQGKVLRSSDHGANWKLLQTGYKGSFWGVLVTDKAVLLHGMRGTIYLSENRGQSWTKIASNTTVGLIAGVALSPSTIVLAGAEGTVLQSTDGGRSFTAASLADHSPINTAVPLSSSSALLLGRSVPNVFKLTTP